MSQKIIELPLDVELLPTIPLRAGDIECLYEKGNLRYLRHHNTEVLRMIYVAVRDENWATADYEIQNEKIEQSENAFTISYTAVYSFGREVYKADISITGSHNSEISFSMEGTALAGFSSNRIGICVLHPLDSSCGRSVNITNPEGKTTEASFPESVTPHQPFINIAEMQWSPSDHETVKLKFRGDIFETEDQRNWTDASFKTYGTPLSIPFPVHVKAGDKKDQSVIYSLVTNPAIPGDREIARTSTVIPDDRRISTNPVVIPSVSEGSTEQELKIKFPKLGFTYHQSDDQQDTTLLKNILFDYYQITLSTNSGNWRQQLQQAINQAKQLKVKLICVINHSTNDDITPILIELSLNADMVHSLSLVPENGDLSNENTIVNYTETIKSKLPDTLIEYASTGHFAELNRNWPNTANIHAVSFPVNPQAHAVDMRTMIDNLGSHAHLVKTTQTFAPAKKIHVGPILFSDSDNRLRNTHFATWWILAAISNLSDADAIIIGPAIGKDGLIRKGNDNTFQLSPLYKILAELKQFNPQWIIKNQSNGLDSMLVVENHKSERLVVRLNYSF